MTIIYEMNIKNTIFACKIEMRAKNYDGCEQAKLKRDDIWKEHAIDVRDRLRSNGITVEMV